MLPLLKKDNDEILKIIKKYYAFEEIKETNKNDIRPIKRQNIVNNKSKEKVNSQSKNTR